jgi:hypothetical protein
MLRNSHSFPLDLLIWNGLPLGMLFIGALVWWWVKQLLNINSSVQWVLLSVVGVVFVHSMFEYPFEYLYFLIPVGLLMGALQAWMPANATGSHRISSVPMAVALVIGAMALGWIGVEYLRVEEASRENRMVAAGYAASAELPDVMLLDEPREYMRFWRTPAQPGMSAETLDWMRKITERNPAPPTLMRFALAMGLNGKPEIASRTLVQLCNMHRTTACDEGRTAWFQAQATYPVLKSVAYPTTPIASR